MKDLDIRFYIFYKDVHYTYLNVSCFFDGLNKMQLQQNVVRPKMHPRHGADDDVDQFDGVNKALVIGKRGFDKAGAVLLKRQ